MNVKEKILLDIKGLFENGPINIVVLGDSVSHGAINGYIDHENVYHNQLRKKLNAFRDYMPVNIINASIGGTCAIDGLKRLDTQVLNHNPDLVIVCFGLNDVNGELEVYLDSLKKIFERCKNAGADVIFMSPNMLNTYVPDDTPKVHFDYSHITAEYQNSGKMDKFIYSAIDLAKNMGVTVCDCYGEWKELSKTKDTTLLLANRINHPTPEMHSLFADKLYETIMGETQNTATSDSTMFKG